MCPAVEIQPIQAYEGPFDLESKIEECDLKNQDAAVNICDLSSIVSKFNDWKRLMPSITPYYAIKCNDELPILKTLGDLGTGFDCASKTEIEQVLSLGFDSDKIIFANPMKSISHIQYARANNVTDSTADNEFEIYKIFKNYPESNIVVRFRSDANKALSPLGNKFGCNAEEDGVALMLLAKSLDVNVKGVSFHVGSGCGDLPAYERAVRTGSALYKAGNLLKHNMELFDIGGGFPGDDDEMFANIAELVNKSLNKYLNDVKVKVIAEPGRYFVSTAYTTICKIFSKRELRGRDGQLEKVMYYVNDGVYGTFNCILYEDLKIDTIHFKSPDGEKFSSLIWGPTCDACDKIVDNIELPYLKDGDFIAFPNMGAYTIPTSSPFNGFTLPKTRFYIRKDLKMI